MKKLYSMFLAAALLVGIASVKAQDRCTLTDNKTFVSEMQVSDNQTVKKVNDHQIISFSNPERNLVLTKDKAVYTLTIAPDGVWDIIIINNDDGFEDYGWYDDDTIFQREVSEGFYDIVILGNGENDGRILAYDQFEVSGDTEFTPSFSEATNRISFDLTDENGTPIEELPLPLPDVGGQLDIFTEFVMSHGSWHLTSSFYTSTLDLYVPFYFNNFGSRITVYNTIKFNTTDQGIYCIQLPTITEGITGDLTLSNLPDDLLVHEEYYNVNNPDSAYFNSAYMYFGPRLGSWGSAKSWQYDCIYNPKEPLRVVTNITNNDEPIVDGGSNMKFMVIPMVYESFDPYHEFTYEQNFCDMLTPFGMALNSEGKMIREPYDMFFKTGLSPAFYPDFVPCTPAMYVYEPTKTLVFGYRTPLLYYQPVNYNAETSPWGAAFFGGLCGYLGEGGVQRMKDEDRTLKITYNGETYFEDSLYLANRTFMYFADAGAVAYDIVNDNLVVDGVAKTNITHIEFDMNRNDALPPTLNLLQVMDANNEEVITVSDLEHSRINFAGGDYHVDLDLYWNMVYDDEAIVEVFYKTEGAEYQPLEYEEKLEMFHINYGIFYEIPLSQLVGEVLNQWVTVKFVLSDMAGNSQTQELFNLFYVDDQTSISENRGLPHVVYPNPFSGVVKITAAQNVNGVANIAVYNILGELVYSKTQNCTETKEFTIDGSAWKAGIYFYSISTEDGLLQGKIIKE